ncbi:D-alanyl-D-alanine carboxypeptidase family protein [Peribacillus sp. B-H-3]|uniref:D-alanyl-D-alanine carboxypeptidase family protein n=1 Tax=Peribacillus sp. B-H-3 TaxID=3400420 RepID=UPI003B02EAD1
MNRYMNALRILFFTFIFIFSASVTHSEASSLTAPDITSGAGVVMDAKTGKILFGKNAEQKMYPASLTKVATAIYALEKADPRELVTVSGKAANEIGSSVYIEKGEKIQLKKLIEGFLINSGNDAGDAIAEHLSGSEKQFAIDLNHFLKSEVHVQHTHFTNPHGLFNSQHVTTAEDLAKITRFALQNPDFRTFIGTKELPWHVKTWDTTLVTHHKLLKGEFPYEGITGGKTGYVRQAGHTLITTAHRNQLDLIAVTLKNNSSKNAYLDTEKLLDYGFNHFVTAKLNKNEKFKLAEKTYSLKSDVYYTQAKADHPKVLAMKDGKLSIKNQVGQVIQSFNLQHIAYAEEKQDLKSTQSKPSPARHAFFSIWSIAIWVLIIVILTIIIKSIRKRKQKNR